MTTIPLESAVKSLEDIARRAEGGERITLTRDGAPITDIVARDEASRDTIGGTRLDRAALDAYKKELGVEKFTAYLAPDFDEPLAEDVLLTPLPK